jgi:hypothetical protein
LDTNWDDEDKNGMAGLLPLSSDSEWRNTALKLEHKLVFF